MKLNEKENLERVLKSDPGLSTRILWLSGFEKRGSAQSCRTTLSSEL